MTLPLRLLALLAVPLSAPLSGCAMPSTVVRTPDSRPSLSIVGAPPGAVLLVDGRSSGPALAYEPPHVLMVEPGTHQIDIADASGRILYSQKVFVESETKTIQVH
ncbi:MAG: hypothetical protein JST92_23680 [Deltaproteobacteria bacterium]|nr:hypothetical protein [Deltaproteobacteria bacterium]